MPTDGDRTASVADLYARTLLNLADEAGVSETLVEQTRDLVHYANDHADFAAFLTGAGVDEEARATVLEKLFRGKLHDLLLNMLLVLNRRGRAAFILEVADRFEHVHRARRGRVEVAVTTAAPLSEGLRSQLVTALNRFTGREPALCETVDPELIGGMVVRFEDRKIDTSVRQQLVAARQALAMRASRELHSGRTYTE